MTPQKENPAGQGEAGRVVYNPKNTHFQHKSQGKFNKDRLPSPMSVLNILGIKAQKTNPAGYMAVRCPFHAGGQEKNPSLSLHAGSGHYKCHACGAKGGDVIALYRAVTGCGFIDALKKLGVYNG